MASQEVVNFGFLLIIFRAKPNQFSFFFVDHTLPFGFRVDLALLVHFLLTTAKLKEEFSVLLRDIGVCFAERDPHRDRRAKGSDHC